MFSQNTTKGINNYFCPFDWKVEYLTKPVYLNLVFSISINLVMFPFSIFFNALLVFIIFRKWSLRKTMSNVAIGYLAITDLGVGAILQPLFIAAQLCRFSKRCSPCVPDTITWFLATILCRSSINHLIVIAWERYVAIKYSLKYEAIVTKNKILSAIMASWFIPILLDAMLLLELKSSVPAFISSVHFVFTFTILIYFYTFIYMESRRHLRQIKTTTPHLCFEKKRFREKELKMAKTVVIIISCLLSCYATCVGISVGKAFFFPVTLSTFSLWTRISSWQYTLIFINSLIKPLVCGWRVKDIKNAGKSIFLPRKSRNKLEINTIEVVGMNENLQDERGNNDDSSRTGGGSRRNLACDTEPTMNLSVKTTLKDPKANMRFASLNILNLRHQSPSSPASSPAFTSSDHEIPCKAT